MGILVRFLLSGLAVLLTAYLLPGIHVKNYGYALLAAAVLSFANSILKPLLVILTIPITILTLGLFLLIINALIILIVDYFVPGFEVDNLWWALIFSLVLSVFNSMFSAVSRK